MNIKAHNHCWINFSQSTNKIIDLILNQLKDKLKNILLSSTYVFLILTLIDFEAGVKLV